MELLAECVLDGDSWQARSADGRPVDSGANVKVTGYDSINF